ncbi:MAG: hypothetical protein JWN29_2774 [Acidimicrobiales bacterium]|nr:hypothetical protein [Acidimicrobiales bacterium]
MGFTLFALLLGVVLGLATGGRPSNVGKRPLRGVGALGAAVVLQALPHLVVVSDTTGLACILGSYVLLVAFALANVRLVGMPVVLVGLLLNVVVIGANSGMPVRGDAILTIDRERTPAELRDIEFGAKRHLEDASDRLTFLGDVVPVPPIGQVLSFGDLILAVGLVNVVFRLFKPPTPIRRRQRRSVGEVVALLPSPGGAELPTRA